ncbi:DUF4974 domain-containing protein [Flavobacteriaceae bacterium F08102]|nr:DUF4974 domain-containing protein [Flavobacteriaceae bacterium F08102]
MSNKNYSNYLPEDFAADAYFQKWVLEDDPMANIFWEKWLADQHPEKQAEVELAKILIHQFRFKDHQATEDDFNDVWKHIKGSQIDEFKSAKRTKNARYVISAAASIIILVAFTLLFNQNRDKPVFDPVVVTNKINPGKDKATLTLEDGTEVELEKNQVFKTKNAQSNGKELVYKPGETTSPEIAYNYLTIPRGGQFNLTLTDGTKIWLNSESQLKYPILFTEGTTRKVELIYGEAYFDVSPSTDHKGSSFKVVNGAQEVEVLGTEFNIKAYKDENFIYTTLVEGKVVVNTANNQETLAPNQQLKLNVSNNDITLFTSTDTFRETAWKNGVFSFKNKPLKDIMKVLARWYDIHVVFASKSLETITFNGSLKKQLSIEEILSIISNTSTISYEITDKTIILKEHT